MYIAFAICMFIVGLVLLRRISSTVSGKLKVFILILGSLFAIGGCILGYFILSGRLA